jgi:hypothetical protein
MYMYIKSGSECKSVAMGEALVVEIDSEVVMTGSDENVDYFVFVMSNGDESVEYSTTDKKAIRGGTPKDWEDIGD